MTPSPGFINPILEEIDRKHGELSAPAQQAIAMARQRTVQPIASPNPSALAPIAAPTTARGLGASSVSPSAPAQSPFDQPIANRAAEIERLNQTGSGISQIRNPIARRSLQVLDALGSTFLPALTMQLPGTQLHHQELLHGQEAQLGELEKGKEAEARSAEAEARGTEATARAQSLVNPVPKEKPIGSVTTANGKVMQFNPDTDRYDIEVGSAEKAAHEGLVQDKEGNVIGWTDGEGRHHALDEPGTPPAITAIAKTAQAKIHTPTEAETPLTDQEIADANSRIATRYQVNHPGQQPPASSQLAKGAKRSDLADLERMLSGTEGAEATAATRAATEEDRRRNQAAEAATHASADTDRAAARLGKPFDAALTASNAQLEKIDEARAMVNGSAAAQGLAIPKVLTALVSGQGTGVRITKSELDAIAHARGIGGEFTAFLQKLSSGKALTPDQQRQISEVLDDAKGRIVKKQKIANDTLDRINGATTREEVVKAESEARKALADMEKGGGGEDAKLKAYADQYFGGDVKKAQAAIDQQRGKK